MVTDPTELLTLVGLDPSLLASARRAAALFPLTVTRPYLERIEKGNINDPLLRQVLPVAEECLTEAEFTRDPLAEGEFNPAKGIIHKYHGRVLLVTTPRCAINCRFCFRRHFDYAANTPSRQQWLQALQYITADTSIDEVILSGGDPLIASDKQLAWLIKQLDGISHLQRLRIHTRLPIVLPSRITDTLISLLQTARLQPVIVVHCNHPNEIDEPVKQIFKMMLDAGITLLNQSVLLKGVNDSASTLVLLSKTLFRSGVLSYYLHMLDKVEGAAHFHLDETDIRKIYSEMLARLPGYLVPKLVKEVPGSTSKTPIF